VNDAFTWQPFTFLDELVLLIAVELVVLLSVVGADDCPHLMPDTTHHALTSRRRQPQPDFGAAVNRV